MKLIIPVWFLFILAVLQSSAAHACDDYASYSIDEIKEFRNMLSKSDADPLDRMFAFEQMACSDRPSIRHYALKEGLNTIKDPLVRNEIMLRAMMQKVRIDVELSKTKQLTGSDKSFIKEHGSVFSNLVTFRSEDDGCLGLHYAKCEPRYSAFVVGNKLELNSGGTSGSFTLSTNGELVGTLRAGNSANYTNIPAVIKLF